MRPLYYALCFMVLMVCSCFSGEWKLVWSDEFDGQGLPDPTKWGYETGFVRNHEMQYYTQSRLENARVENGCLVIEGRKEEWPNPAFVKGSDNWRKSWETAHYTSASLVTLPQASWTYGRIEIRAKIPKGKGVWPALWTLGANHHQVGWPRCGEIDIMEYIGRDPDGIHANVHYDDKSTHGSRPLTLRRPEPYAQFHLYAVEWYPDRIDFYFDGEKYHSFPIEEACKGQDNPFCKPHYLLLNLALGGEWGGEIDDTLFPQKFLIDYVRVYQ